MRYYGWPEYVPVAQRRAKAQKQLVKMRKKGLNIQPVQLAGRRIAASFWGKGWCDHMESFSDYANRLPRGRSYVRNGSVCHLEIRGGEIEAIVSGTSLYKVNISIKPLPATRWQAVKRSCAGRIGSLIDLLRGKLDHGVMEVVTHRKEGLFPLPGEMKFDCDCPDWAGMCKHVAAVLYGVGARLDQSPEMLFVLRGVNHEELVDVTAAITDVAKSGTSRRRIATSGIADVFGIELAETAVDPPAEPPAPSGKRVKPKQPGVPKTKTKDRLAAARRVRCEAAAGKTKTVANNLRADKVAVKGKAAMESPSFPEPLTGDAIRAWRLSLGETQAAFAARFKVSGATVSVWEKKGKAEVGMFSDTHALLRKAWRKTRRG
ncbi:SWIM zinc finger family protein [Geobacter sp.]|uniref:SWIM zinc finger family protein n=1 Tax=Geobacter sp. TaxID=46610 RepID=UPI0026106FDC|nr:SWIM zinc finger family protein [Geobacter sp.]